MSRSGLDFFDLVPWSDCLTDYDRSHAGLYLRLLDAEMTGAGRDEIARLVFGLDPENDPRRAAAVVDSHLKRAHWMVEHGYRDLLAG